jgi:hypothetical protein
VECDHAHSCVNISWCTGTGILYTVYCTSTYFPCKMHTGISSMIPIRKRRVKYRQNQCRGAAFARNQNHLPNPNPKDSGFGSRVRCFWIRNTGKKAWITADEFFFTYKNSALTEQRTIFFAAASAYRPWSLHWPLLGRSERSSNSQRWW